MISLTITYPPSANRLWRNVGGKVLKSAHYRAWMAENLHLGYGRQDAISGPYSLSLVVYPPDKRLRDLDNLIKPLGDLLQASGIVANDHAMKRLYAEWGSGGPARVQAIVEPFEVAA